MRASRNSLSLQLAAMLAALSIGFAACGGGEVVSSSPGPSGGAASSEPSSTPAQEPDEVTLILDFLPGAVHLGFYSALAEGYYADESLEVEIIPGRGSRVASQLVAAGSATFGFADFTAMADGIAAGQPVKMVAGMLQRGTGGLGYLCDEVQLDSPEDLVGKRIAGPAGTSTFLLLEVLLNRSGLNPDDFDQVIVDSGAQTATVMAGQADARTTVIYDQRLQIEAEAAGREACTFVFADHGVEYQGHGIIVNNATAIAEPDLVRRFVAASMRGWQFSIDNPDAARAEMIELAPDAIVEELERGWEFIPPVLHTERSEGEPLGWMHPDDIIDSLNLLEEGGILATRLPEEVYYTNEFVSDE